jgi:hypothetical protein
MYCAVNPIHAAMTTCNADTAHRSLHNTTSRQTDLAAAQCTPASRAEVAHTQGTCANHSLAGGAPLLQSGTNVGKLEHQGRSAQNVPGSMTLDEGFGITAPQGEECANAKYCRVVYTVV